MATSVAINRAKSKVYIRFVGDIGPIRFEASNWRVNDAGDLELFGVDDDGRSLVVATIARGQWMSVVAGPSE